MAEIDSREATATAKQFTIPRTRDMDSDRLHGYRSRFDIDKLDETRDDAYKRADKELSDAINVRREQLLKLERRRDALRVLAQSGKKRLVVSEDGSAVFDSDEDEEDTDG